MTLVNDVSKHKEIVEMAASANRAMPGSSTATLSTRLDRKEVGEFDGVARKSGVRVDLIRVNELPAMDASKQATIQTLANSMKNSGC